MGLFKTSSPGDSISSNPERTALRRPGEDPSGYIEVLPQRAGSLNWSLLIKENQITQVMEFSASLCMGRCKSLNSLKSSLSFAFWPSEASILCFSHPELLWSSQRGVAAVCWLLDPQVFFLSSLRAHQLTLKDCNRRWLWHPCFLIWVEIFHFSAVFQ